MTTRTIRKTLSFLTALLLLLLTAGCGGKTAPATDESEDALVSQILLDDAASGIYLSGECSAEGHVWLGWQQEDETRWNAYLIASEGQYGFCSGHFECISGSGAIPIRLTLVNDKAGALTLEKFWMPEDGSYYADSIKEAFPQEYWDKALAADQYYEELKTQKEAYALAYLNSIGREAEIGEYRDFEHPLFTDQGMSVTASNALSEIGSQWSFPYYIGNVEILEDGVRYVYETAWDHQGDGKGTVTYTKTNYETHEVVQQLVYQVDGDTVTQQVLRMTPMEE